MNKENIAATPTFTRKRAKSVSTPPSAKPPTKSARGILKGNNGDDAHTIAFIPIHSPSKRTESAEKRRKSLNRRVSFASHATVRLFDKPGESPTQTPPRRSTRNSPAKSPIVASRSFGSPSESRHESSAIDGPGDQSNDDITMDLTNIVPRIAPVLRQTNPLSNASPMSDDEDDSDDGDVFGDATGEDDTAAMDLTDVLPASSNAVAMSPFRRSPRARSPGKSPATPHSVMSFAEEEDADDSMDITTALGKIRPVTTPSRSPAKSVFAESPAVDHTMEMTLLVGGILDAAQSEAGSPSRNGDFLSEQNDDQTMNMEETRVYSSDRRSTLADEPTSHTSCTVATEEDDTQRYVEGSVTQADGLTQNMDFTRALPIHIRLQSRDSPVRNAHVGFAWGTAPATMPPTIVQEQSLVDISMADVTMNEDETMNMDMTRAVPGDILGLDVAQESGENRVLEGNEAIPAACDFSRRQSNGDESEIGTEVDMSMTRIMTPSNKESPRKRTPHTTTPSGSKTRSMSPTKSSLLKRKLSSGALRSPMPSPGPATPIQSSRASVINSSRRQSLIDAHIPSFGTPETKASLEPNSIQKPEFGSTLVNHSDIRVSLLKERIQSLTPRKSTSTPAPHSAVTTPRLKAIAEPFSSKLAKFATPLGAVDRRTSTASATKSASRVSHTPTIRTINSQSPIQPPLEPITLNDFLKMTGVSFLTGLSTTRRRETIMMPTMHAKEAEEDPAAAKLMAENFTLPMLEMYQHSCRELTRYITEGRAMCEEIESDMNEQNPEIFDIYRRANPEEKLELEAKFKAMKTKARLSAKGVWYVWRENLIKGVLVPLKKNLAELQKEEARLKAYEEFATPEFERVQAEHDQLKAELEQLIKEEEIYESYDHEEAARLQARAAEVDAAIEQAKAEVDHLRAEDAQLDTQLAALELQHKAKVIEVERLEKEAAERKGYTNQEIAELKAEYEAHSRSTGYTIHRVDNHHISLTLLESLRVSLSLADSQFSLSLPAIETIEPDTKSVMKQYFLQHLVASLADRTDAPLPQTFAYIRDLWRPVLALQQEVHNLHRSWPTEIFVNEDDNLVVQATLLLPLSRTKLRITFISTPNLLTGETIGVDRVEVVYGGLDAAKVKTHIESRLLTLGKSAASSAGWLLDSIKMPDGL